MSTRKFGTYATREEFLESEIRTLNYHIQSMIDTMKVMSMNRQDMSDELERMKQEIKTAVLAEREALEEPKKHIAKHRRLEAITAIKEALAQPEQEPVAWGFQNSAITGRNRWMMLREDIPTDDQYGGALWTPLFTSPPKREWVSLTDDELLKTYGWEFESYGQSDRPSSLGQSIVDEAKQEIIDGLRKVEAALKEKNT